MNNKMNKIKLLVFPLVVALCLTPVFALATSNDAEITQIGDNNSALIVQDGTANSAIISQTGSLDYAVTVQNEGGAALVEETNQDQVTVTLTY